MSKQVETIVIGGGQAGLATSYCLKQRGHEHLILEQASRAGNAWRNGRWDSFTLVTPNWSIDLPGATYRGDNPKGFMARDDIVSMFESYTETFDLPIRYTTTVRGVLRLPNGKYRVSTDDGDYEAANVVVATGLYQRPRIPAFSSKLGSHVEQMHSSEFRNAEALPSGAVLIVGSAQSGAQIADDLNRNGRKVYLSVGKSGRGPRRYRGKDIFEWIVESGSADRTADQLPHPNARFAPSPHVSGVDGGRSLNLHQFARDGIVLLGRMQSVNNGAVELAADLKENLKTADDAEIELTKYIDRYIEEAGIDAPPEELPKPIDGYQAEIILDLNLKNANINTVIWATGYSFDFSLVKVPIFDPDGFPVTNRGATESAGLYFVGMPWIYTSRSGLLSGVGRDAEFIAKAICGD
jgi:putative flavoprotein involved in K+ transport